MSNQCEGGGVNVGHTDWIGLGPQLVVLESTQLGKWCGQKSPPVRNQQLRPPIGDIQNRSAGYQTTCLKLCVIRDPNRGLHRVGDTQIRNPIAYHTDRVEEWGNLCLPLVRLAHSGSNRSVVHTKTTGLTSRPDPARVQGLGFVDTTLRSCWVRWLLGDLLNDGFGGGGFSDFGGFKCSRPFLFSFAHVSLHPDSCLSL